MKNIQGKSKIWLAVFVPLLSSCGIFQMDRIEICEGVIENKLSEKVTIKAFLKGTEVYSTTLLPNESISVDMAGTRGACYADFLNIENDSLRIIFNDKKVIIQTCEIMNNNGNTYCDWTGNNLNNFANLASEKKSNKRVPGQNFLTRYSRQFTWEITQADYDRAVDIK